MLLVLHKVLLYKVEKLLYKKLEVMQIRTSSWWISHPHKDQSTQSFTVVTVFIQSIIYLWTIIRGRGGGLISFLPLKRGRGTGWPIREGGGGVFEGGRLIEDLRYVNSQCLEIVLWRTKCQSCNVLFNLISGVYLVNVDGQSDMTDTVRLSDWPSFHVNVKDYIRINWSQTFLSLVVECGSKFNAIIESEGKLSDRWEEGAAAF